MTKFKIEYAEIEYYESAEIEASTLEEAESIHKQMVADGELITVNSENHYIKIYDAESKDTLKDTATYNDWSIEDVNDEIDDMKHCRDTGEPEAEMTLSEFDIKANSLTVDQKKEILFRFLKYLNLADIREYQMRPVIKEYLDDIELEEDED